jgi:hypothetical protein
MINFRFHLVSLVAVFLALGLGILVGSTVVDQKIVDRLDADIANVRRENAERRDTNKQLAQENAQLREFLDGVAPYANDARLDGQSIAVVAEDGVDGDTLKDAAQALRDAGAEVPGVVWLEDAWQLDDEKRVEALQTALGIDGSVTQTREVALNQLAERLAGESGAESSSTSTTRGRGAATSTTAPTANVDALTALEQAGFLRVTEGDLADFESFPNRAPSVLVVTGDASRFLGSGFTTAFVRALADTKAPTALAAVYDPGDDPDNAPERGASLAPVLDDQALSRLVSTVDDLDLQQGRIAAVLTLARHADGGEVGHYGYGAGASAPLPAHGA